MPYQGKENCRDDSINSCVESEREGLLSSPDRCFFFKDSVHLGSPHNFANSASTRWYRLFLDLEVIDDLIYPEDKPGIVFGGTSLHVIDDQPFERDDGMFATDSNLVGIHKRVSC